MKRARLPCWWVLPGLFLAACSGRTTTNDDATTDESCGSECDGSSTGGAASTSGSNASSTVGGASSAEGTCVVPGQYLCVDNTLHLCTDSGQGWTTLLVCGSDQRCDSETGSCEFEGNAGRGGSPVTSTGSSTTGFVAPCDVDAAFFTCQGSVCHGQRGVSSAVTLGAGLDLFEPDRETTLVDREATYLGVADTSLCPIDDPELIIDSKNPPESLLITKILGTQSCGATEPMVGTLDDAARQCIIDWVTALAEAAADD